MKDRILEVLEKENKGLSLIEINNLLNLETPAEYEDLSLEVNNLVTKGIIHKSKKDKFMLMNKCTNLKTGYVHINKSGNGFVEIENSDEEDIFVPKKSLNGAIDGDYVEVDTQFNNGVICKILERNINTLIGEIVKKHNKLEFALDDKKKDIVVKITQESMRKCVEGHKVVVKIIKELSQNLYLGEVTKVIGHKNDPGVDILTVAYKHDIEFEFNDGVKKEVETLPYEVRSEDKKGRRDLTNEEIFTIDGDDTKDIDDAISIKKDGENYILGVHIADVSYYVREGSYLFNSAYEKGTSSYLADTVLPMLPHELSNGICSLNEGVERLALSCVMTINTKGKVIDYDIFPSVIKSNKKMTYKNVNKILHDECIPEGYEPFVNSLKMMKELADILRKEKISRGYIDFGLDEAKVIQDEEGNPIDIVKRMQDDGEKLIEDFMIAANETVATHVSNMDLPFVYRVHGAPKPEKVEDFLNFIKILGYKVNTNVNGITPITMQKILNDLSDAPEFAILSDVLLRSMKKAVYSTENIGHFGLGSKCYTHFTSPIRRFPDLIVHTLLRKYCFNNDLSVETVKYYEKQLPLYADHASEKEVGAQEAEREVLDMKMAEYMESHIGEEFDGIITTVTNFGMFVELPNLVEGLVHISTLKGFYNYVPELLALVSENKVKYTLGDKVRVKVTGASKENRTIDFELVINDGNKKQKGKL